jgi:hypothetical protein
MPFTSSRRRRAINFLHFNGDNMKKIGEIRWRFFCACLAVILAMFVGYPARAQMNNPGAPGNVTAGNGLGQVGQVISLTAPVTVANGGTAVTSASGTALDNITGFSGTGYVSRTGAGAYSFTASSGSGNIVLANGSNPVPTSIGGTNCATASGTCLDNITGFSSTGFVTRTGAGAYSFESATNGITLANIAQETANTILCNATSTLANIANCIGFNLADPGPTWASLNTIYDSSRTAVNGYPIAQEFGNNTVGVAQALVGAIDAPSSVTSTANMTGVAGYARVASNNPAAVGVYGQGTLNSGGLSAFGGNFLTTNCPTQICNATQGFNADLYGVEIDVNNATTSTGGVPTGSARGLYINGDLNTQMTGMYGIEIDHAGTYGWTDGLNFNAGCCSNAAIQIGQTATGNSQGSNSVNFLSTNSSGTQQQTSLIQDSSGNFDVIAPTSVSVQATLTATKAAKVFATNSSGKSFLSGTAATINSYTTVRDANSNFNASTGTFTAPATADYLVCEQTVLGGTGASNGVWQVSVVANGTTWATFNSPVWSSTVTDTTSEGCVDVYVSSGQTITLSALQNSGSTQTLSTTGVLNYVSITQVP